VSSGSSKNAVGVFSQVGSAPRFYWLMAAMVPASFAGSTIGSIKVILAAQTGGVSTVGTAALVSTVTGCIAGLLAGRVVDRVRANVVLACSMAGFMLSYLSLAFLVAHNSVTDTWVIFFSAVDGAIITFSFLSTIKIDAALVRPNARGAAESISSIRASVGGLLGALLAGSIVLIVDRVIFCAVLTGITFVLVLVIPRGVMARSTAKKQQKGSVAVMLGALKSNPSFRTVVIANLTLYLVVPSTLLSLSVVREGLLGIQGVLVGAGIVGVMAGRLTLAARGTRGAVSRDLTLATLLYAFLAAIAAVGMVGDWLFGQTALLALLIMLGSACGSFTQSMLAAKFQEQVPDAVRGQASGVMYAAVAVQLALGIVVTTSVVSAWSTFAYSVLLACLLLFAVVFLQGFRQVK